MATQNMALERHLELDYVKKVKALPIALPLQ